MNKIFNAYKIKLILTCMLALIAVLSVVHIVVYITTKNIIENQFGLSSQSTAVAISKGIMEDVGSYKRFLETRDVSSDYYQRMQRYFADIKAVSNIKYIYTERMIDEKTVEFILDAEVIGTEDYSPPGTTTFMDDASRTVYTTSKPASLKPVKHPEYGMLLGGCAPIFDGDGNLLGLTGVNVDASQVFTHLNNLQLMMIAVYLFIIALSVLLLKKYSNTILEPILKDKLTGAYSKRYMEKLMQTELKAAQRNASELALMMLDLDHFKKINDTYGHGFGDIVLASVSKTIAECLRKTDYFFRYGGEEFLVTIAQTDVDTVRKIAERIRTSIERSEIFNEERNIPVTITISIGIARMDSSVTSWKELIENADKALYNAKVTRNCVSVF